MTQPKEEKDDTMENQNQNPEDTVTEDIEEDTEDEEAEDETEVEE